MQRNRVHILLERKKALCLIQSLGKIIPSSIDDEGQQFQNFEWENNIEELFEAPDDDSFKACIFKMLSNSN